MVGKFEIRRARRRAKKLRLALAGPAGSGKTLTALFIAKGLASPDPDGKVVLLDTEEESATLFADDPELALAFDTLRLDNFDPRNYWAAIDHVERSGHYSVCIIDCLSHAWGALLDFVDEKTQASRSKNAYTEGWKEAKPIEHALFMKILRSPLHMIATLRTETDYQMQMTPSGKMQPVKVGMKPIQRKGVEHEFDLVGEMDYRHAVTFSKSRIRPLTDKRYEEPKADLGEFIRDWLEQVEQAAPEEEATAAGLGSEGAAPTAVVDPAGHAMPPAPEPTSQPGPEPEVEPEYTGPGWATLEQVAEIWGHADRLGWSCEDLGEKVHTLTGGLTAQPDQMDEHAAEALLMQQRSLASAADWNPLPDPAPANGADPAAAEFDEVELPDAERPAAPEKKPRKGKKTAQEAAAPATT